MTLSELDCSSINSKAILHDKRQGPESKNAGCSCHVVISRCLSSRGVTIINSCAALVQGLQDRWRAEEKHTWRW